MRLKEIIVAVTLFLNGITFGQVVDTSKKELAKPTPEKNALKFNINADGSHYFQVTFLNQTWVRFTENNPGTTVFQKKQATTFDVGLRRTRIQLFGQINKRTFIYFQFGQNNFNNTAGYAGNGNRKIAAFFHDALCEYKVSKGNQLNVGAGLTILNGLSRFSQPSIGTIMTLDVPVFLQFTVDQTDQFARRLALYAHGMLGRLDYRVFVSNPFPINSNGQSPPAISANANFVNPAVFTGTAYPNGYGPGINHQYGGYFSYNLLDKETHPTPYTAGTYLGTKKILNVATGFAYQKAATWRLKQDAAGVFKDTTYEDMLHLSFETFLDMPVNKDKGTAVSSFAGYYITNYGKNYLRYNGLMNPATGAVSSATANMIQGNAFGNAFPMFGSGQVVYLQAGYLLPKKLLGENNGQLMPFVSTQYADYTALQNKPMIVVDAGFNWLIQGHKSKISIDYQNRPTYYKENGLVKSGTRKSCVIAQYQIFF